MKDEKNSKGCGCGTGRPLDGSKNNTTTDSAKTKNSQCNSKR